MPRFAFRAHPTALKPLTGHSCSHMPHPVHRSGSTWGSLEPDLQRNFFQIRGVEFGWDL